MMENDLTHKVALVVAGLFALLFISVFHSSATIQQFAQVHNEVMDAMDVSDADNLTAAPPRRPIQKSKPSKQSSPFLLPKTDLQLVRDFDRQQECTADPQQPLQKVVGVYENYSNISQLFHLPKIIDSNQALACTFQTNQAYGKHFAHAMQQLYGCFSLYQQYPLSSRKVLVIPPELQTKLGTNPFLNGFFRFLQDELKVELLGPNGVQDMEYVSPTNTFTPGGYHISHTAELNRHIQSFLSLPDDPNEDCHRGDEIAPRIGILNRRPAVGRSIQNTAKVVTALEDLSWNKTVSVKYFEGTSFADQVEFFRGIDILLTPHGAQNTGIPFMANKRCSHVVEVFPENYLLPTFYGSLARNAGIGYSYLYLSPHADGSLSRKEDSTLEGRVHARAVNFCLEPNAILESVASLVNDWKACCQRP